MTNRPRRQFPDPRAPQIAAVAPTMRPPDAHHGVRFHGGVAIIGALAVSLLGGGVAAAQGNSPKQLRRFIGQQVGGIQKLMVPAHDADLPQPRLADGSPDSSFRTTEAKRYLGKMLFFDPIRTARIDPDFGGVPETGQTGSCGRARSSPGTRWWTSSPRSPTSTRPRGASS